LLGKCYIRLGSIVAHSLDALLPDFGQESLSVIDFTLAVYNFFAKLLHFGMCVFKLDLNANLAWPSPSECDVVPSSP